MITNLRFDFNVTDIPEGLVIKFLRRLPRMCREAKVGLDLDNTQVTIRVIPECPDGHAFKEQIFMGSGAHSERNSGLLFGKLEEALSVLSGMQQNGMMGYAFDKGSDQKDGKRLEVIVKDMAMALTGMEIEFK